jgi:phosphatidylserine/phosphatidylglycerophosphate/cardiolipin synthase-like enzyme
MTTLRPAFDLSEAQLFTAPDYLAHFPDRYLDSPPPATPARFEGSPIILIRIAPAGGHTDFAIQWPADSCTKAVDLGSADASALGMAKLLELSVMPFPLDNVLSAMQGGVPTFYIGYSGVPYPPDDTAARTTDTPIRVTSAVFGIVFQDRATLAPSAWFDRIAAALRAAQPQDAAAWQSWSALFASRRSLRVLDAQGRPFAGQSITITITDTSGNTQTATRVSDANGELPGLPLPVTGQSGTVSWQISPPLAEETLPVMALVEGQTDAVPAHNSFPITGGFSGGHLQLLALSQWFAPNLHDDPQSPAIGARYRLASRMEPIVDGIPAFNRLLEDLRRVNGPGGAAYFAGWAFTDFPLNTSDASTSLLKLIPVMRDQGAEVRVLVAQFLQASDQSLSSMSQEAGLVLLLLLAAGNTAAQLTLAANYTTHPGLAVWGIIAVAGLVLYITELSQGSDVAKALRKATEQTDPDYFDTLAALNQSNCTTVHSPHPVALADNPLSTDFPLPDGRHLSDLQDKWGVFHQKIQLVKHTDATPGDDRYIAYVGGIDINENRLDSSGHQGAGYLKPASTSPPTAAPFHDVHSRITGAAAMEVFEVFKGRAHRDLPAAPPTASPAPSEWGTPGRDVMQVAQTSFKPKPGSGTAGFDWAPLGNATIHDTIIRAIKSAREYIYIEEQYMVADDAYIDALTDAADHCKRLVIVLPSFLEIFFGDERRTQMFQKMAGTITQPKWSNRMLIGTPMRRPVLAAPDRVTSIGRCILLADIGQSDSQIFLGPPARIPKGRFFFWIGGELMYATGSTPVTGPDGKPAKQLDVLRGGFGTSQRWCPDPRPHQKGEPATFSQPTGIFVHSKIMMIDDLFVSIGSTNINRRGFFHDGEITTFVIPQDLRGAADNPARDLRTRLWAEQLGLAPDMGAPLLADPIAGFELFRRSRYQGNRFVPLTELALPTPTLGDLPTLTDALPDWAKQFLQFGVQITLEAESDNIFNTLSDPTTLIDPHPTPGPGLPP